MFYDGRSSPAGARIYVFALGAEKLGIHDNMEMQEMFENRENRGTSPESQKSPEVTENQCFPCVFYTFRSKSGLGMAPNVGSYPIFLFLFMP